MKKLIPLFVLSFLFFGGCTKNERARQYGGTAVEKLPTGQKLVNVTWKEENLWFLTKPMRSDDVAETYSFKESSSYGVWEGEVIIKETK